MKKLIKIENIIIDIEEKEGILEKKILKILNIGKQELGKYKISKKAVDARNKNRIRFVYSVLIDTKNPEKIYENINPEKIKKYRIDLQEPYKYEIKKANKKGKIVIVGSGPSGLFAGLNLAKAGLKPIIIERGKDVDTRIKDVNKFLITRKLNPNSNIQFGEGGAGTFSDGKLYTLINDNRINYVFQEFIKAGAEEEIAYDAKPHIGTDKIRNVIKNIRKEIIELGGEVLFDSCLTDIKIEKGKVKSIIINSEKELKVDELILAIGHSARDTYKMLNEKLEMEARSFSMGFRIEHSAIDINKSQYGKNYNNSKLKTATYKLVAHSKDKRSVYTFCMCPGGSVVPASSEEGKLAINGMSEYKRDGENSNSALLVNVNPSDFESNNPLSGIEFQRKWEEKAFIKGGENYNAPVQLVKDFLENKKSTRLGKIKPTYKPGYKLTSLNDCLPDFIIDSIKEALPELNKKLNGFINNDAILTGIESRSSASLRIIRDKETLISNINGIYPIGEGAGYAGGIVSSAIDGIKLSEIIIEKYL